jgi:predicted Fe-S protein YdhL (DUF1289 family)
MSQPTQAALSPCRKICTYDPARQICTGCGRNLSEIERWPRLSDAERISLMETARVRLQSLGAPD